jgi:hypothetical protein
MEVEMIYIGIDWSVQKHDVVFMNEEGVAIAKLTIPAKLEGFQKMDAVREQLGVAPTECQVALETAHNLAIDYLWSHDYHQVFVVPPNVVKSTRGRYRQSGARSDESDALLLADLPRTDRARIHPWFPDSLLTRQLRADISTLMFWTKERTRLVNRLQSVLLRYYPAALQVFSGLTTLIALEFIRKYPTPQEAAQLTWDDFQAFVGQHRYTRPAQLPAYFAQLQAVSQVATADTVQIYQQEAVWLAEQLLQTIGRRKQIEKQVASRFQQHPDRYIFSSLPGTGDFLAPALLVKFGDDRQRFPFSGCVQALAGTCPVTDSSGKRRVIKFRRACDKQFRHIAQQFAIASRKQSVWANAYWLQVRPHCRSDSHANRCLANRWLAIIWKLWQSNQTYDEAYHLQQRAKRAKPRS